MSDPSPVKAIMDILVEAASAASTIGEGCTVEVVLAEEVKRLRASICALRARVSELEAPARRSAVKAPEYRETCECWHDDTAHANDRDACMVPRCGCKVFVLKRSSLP